MYIQYYEILKLFYSESCGMELRLVGEAVEPHVVLEPDTNRMELGHTYVGDTSVKKLQLKNTCSLGIHYRVKLQGRTNKEGKFSKSNMFLTKLVCVRVYTNVYTCTYMYIHDKAKTYTSVIFLRKN